jgi:hypothetical protein
MLCIDMGNLALQIVFAPNTFYFENGPQAARMAGDSIRRAWQEGKMD